jgi:hypothetical protein
VSNVGAGPGVGIGVDGKDNRRKGRGNATKTPVERVLPSHIPLRVTLQSTIQEVLGLFLSGECILRKRISNSPSGNAEYGE